MSNYSDKSGVSFRLPIEFFWAFDRLMVFAAETIRDDHFERRVRGRGFDREHVRIGDGAESRGTCGQRIPADQDVKRVFCPNLLDFQVAAFFAAPAPSIGCPSCRR